MRISPADAVIYFAHPTQRRESFLPEGEAPPDWCVYYAKDGVCLAFHGQFWPGVYQVHIGVLPGTWGHTTEPVKVMLRQFAVDENAQRVVAWVKESNRAVIALARRCGFEIDGRVPVDIPALILGWRP
jgi:hypothetical protein